MMNAIYKEMDIKKPKGEKAKHENPFIVLGYGINAFFEIQFSLFWMFVWITLFMIPIYMMYSSNGEKGLKNMDATKWKYNIHKW